MSRSREDVQVRDGFVEITFTMEGAQMSLRDEAIDAMWKGVVAQQLYVGVMAEALDGLLDWLEQQVEMSTADLLDLLREDEGDE